MQTNIDGELQKLDGGTTIRSKTWWEIEGKQPGDADFSYAWAYCDEVEKAERMQAVKKAEFPEALFRRVKVTRKEIREPFEAI